MISVTVKSRDNGLLGRIKRVASQCTSKIEIGYFGEVHGGKTPITLNRLAAIHEYGTNRIPKRPFVHPPLKQNRGKYLKITGKQIASSVMGRGRMSQTWHYVGQAAVSDVQNYMLTGKFAPLAASTVRRKGSSKPLIDTGQMRQSITYRVK